MFLKLFNFSSFIFRFVPIIQNFAEYVFRIQVDLILLGLSVNSYFKGKGTPKINEKHTSNKRVLFVNISFPYLTASLYESGVYSWQKSLFEAHSIPYTHSLISLFIYKTTRCIFQIFWNMNSFIHFCWSMREVYGRIVCSIAKFKLVFLSKVGIYFAHTFNNIVI